MTFLTLLSFPKATSHLKSLALCAGLSALLLARSSGVGESAELPGYDRFDIQAGHRGTLVQGSVWYPAGSRTYAVPVGDAPLFHGTRALIGPRIAEGQFPLVVLSHGSGGNMDNLGWLSSELALRGAMVLAVNHPGSTSGDSSPRRSARFSDRVKDLSAALDLLLNDPEFGPKVDRSQVYSLGFSLGGSAALQSIGLQLKAEKIGDYCADNPTAPGCDFYGKGGVDFRNVDFKFTDGDYGDPRFTGTIAVDPGWPYAFTKESVSQMEKPVLLINLGNQETLPEMVNVGEKGSGLANVLPNAAHMEIAPAAHFSFLALCKDKARFILKEEGEDPICDDPEGSDRAQVHRQVIDAVSRFLELNGAREGRQGLY
ncbi:alpha/beta hydrolase family protein [Roseibium sp.]|uniref:alpha/beta hydrolase family protein n=1 Tax=Roseibium sp. TaxID=1936156 RepID=UPI003A973759